MSRKEIDIIPVLITFILIMENVSISAAQVSGEYSSLYAPDTLGKFREENIEFFRESWEHVKSALPAKHHEKASHIRINLPLWNSPPPKDPFAFYSIPKANEIVLPIASVMFLNDILLAEMWDARHGCLGVRTDGYIAMIRYQPQQRLPGGPLKALGIEWSTVDDALIKEVHVLTSSVIYFIMAHELAHIISNDDADKDITPEILEKARQRELRADFFALFLLKDMGIFPAGVMLHLKAQHHRTLVKNDFIHPWQYMLYLLELSVHPFVPERLRMLAAFLSAYKDDYIQKHPEHAELSSLIPALVKDTASVANTLENQSYREAFAKRGRGMTLASLSACRKKETNPSAP